MLFISPNFWLLLIIGLVVLAFISIFSKKQYKQTYDDSFGNSSSISLFNKGIWIAGGRITEAKSTLHCALISQSGGGKTSTVLLPTALGLDNCSIVLLDPAKELFTKSAGHLAEKGYKIKVLDFLDVTRSVGFNPLLRATTNTDLHMLSDLIFAPTMRNSKDVFWSHAGAKFLTLFFKIQKRLPEQYQNLANTLHLITLFQGSPKLMDKLVSRIADPALFEEYKFMLRYDSKLLSNVVATVMSCLKTYENDNIAKVTAVDTLCLEDFRKEKTALFIQMNVLDTRYYSSLLETLFFQLFRHWMSAIPTKEELSIYVLADEMGSITVKGFAEALSNLRKYRVSVTYAIQSRSQLVERYGREDARTILANSYHQLIFPGMETDLAQELETRFGRHSFEREDGSRGTRELMTVSELVHLKEGHAIYISGPNRPLKVKLNPYYKNYFMAQKANIPPPKIRGDVSGKVVLVDPLDHAFDTING